jgi:hypothetical protein
MGEPAAPRGPSDRAGAPRGGPPGVPRWVKVLEVVALSVVVAVVLLVVGGEHRPGRHTEADAQRVFATAPVGDQVAMRAAAGGRASAPRGLLALPAQPPRAG